MGSLARSLDGFSGTFLYKDGVWLMALAGRASSDQTLYASDMRRGTGSSTDAKRGGVRHGRPDPSG